MQTIAISIPTPGGCWYLADNRSKRSGYVFVRTGAGRRPLGHRWAWNTFRPTTPIPPDQMLDHFRCDDRACINPYHTRPVTARENALRSDGITARNAAKRFCTHGHPLSASNVRLENHGTRRRCVTCKRLADKRRGPRRRE